MTFNSSGKPASSSTAAAIDASHLRDVLRRAEDPVVARLLRDFITEHELQQSYPGAYLVAMESIKRSQTRYARAKERGILVRRLALRIGAALGACGRTCVDGVVWLAQRCVQAAARRRSFGAVGSGQTSNVLVLPGPSTAASRRSAAHTSR